MDTQDTEEPGEVDRERFRGLYPATGGPAGRLYLLQGLFAGRRIESERCNNTQRQPSGNSGGLDMTQSTGSPLAADSKS